MLKQRMSTGMSIITIVLSLFLCSCQTREELPEGAEYFEPVWFENLSEFVTGNHNEFTKFKDGLSVVSFSEMSENWSRSDIVNVVIDRSGELAFSPFYGDYDVSVIDSESIYVEDNESETGVILDINSNVIGAFDGCLISDRKTREKMNAEDVAVLGYNNIISTRPYQNKWLYGLAKKNGEVLVDPTYCEVLAGVSEEYFIFSIDDTQKNADVYHTDGTFLHRIDLEYGIYQYKNGMFILHSDSGYGVANITGTVIFEPNNKSVNVLSEDLIIVSKSGSNDYQLFDGKGNLIKDLELSSAYQISQLYNDVFAVCDYSKTYFISSEGEFLKEYEGRFARYCGDGVFSIQEDDEVQLVDGDTLELIGEKYRDTYDIKFYDGYSIARDLDGNDVIIDCNGNKYCEGYDVLGVSENIVRVSRNKYPGVIYLPPQK